MNSRHWVYEVIFMKAISLSSKKQQLKNRYHKIMNLNFILSPLKIRPGPHKLYSGLSLPLQVIRLVQHYTLYSVHLITVL